MNQLKTRIRTLGDMSIKMIFSNLAQNDIQMWIKFKKRLSDCYKFSICTY